MMTSEYTKFKITGGNPVQVRPLPFMRNVCGDRLNFLYDMKREEFKITDAEVSYWKHIHDLNCRQPRIDPKNKPVHVREYLLQFVELIKAKG